jgi:hypothetical protein
LALSSVASSHPAIHSDVFVLSQYSRNMSAISPPVASVQNFDGGGAIM